MKLASFPICAALCAFAVSSCASGSSDMQEAYLEKAKTTMQSVYTCYSVAENFLLRENYPFDDGYKAGYLASEEQASRPNPYSYLWPFSGTLSAVAAIMETEPSYQDILTGRVLPGLEEYYDAKREPHAYSSYIKSAPASDRFYDDNVWLGIDFTDLYVLTEKPEYLEKAEMIWKFIESGIDDKLGGGIYWCEQKKGSKNTCSNAPGSVFALKLYKATGNPHYLEQGKALYEWTRNTLMDSTDFLYFDNINLSGKIQTWKFAYNSGQMVQAGALLYGITGDKKYLSDAARTAESCYDYFFEDYTAEDGTSFRILKAGNTWFNAVMVRGLIELYRADGNRTYIDAVRKSLDTAWEKSRTEEGLFNDDCSGRKTNETKWLLVQGAMAEMYARMAAL
ncbi:MAG: AGE family epimerase/isomerase [Bacteroidetes bacterium]|uniref:AGE family epimerase/isomerase n=1 Tax=Candidatus Cryptobacteroides avicola TaxID=2840757 RepID=A0A940IIF0_9BACT|nr:AGE family epimerase/isomerase [Candidatus Cryptobacteroides avicola]